MFKSVEKRVREGFDLSTIKGKLGYVEGIASVLRWENDPAKRNEGIQIMAGAVGLPADTIRREVERKKRSRIPFGQEVWAGQAVPGNCHDCGVKKGKLHKPFCDVERCPKCRQQLLYCGCIL